MQDRYLRWLLGVIRSVPGYMVREELQREKLEGRAGMRAWGYEKKLKEEGEGELARRCWEKIKRRAKDWKARVGRRKGGAFTRIEVGGWKKQREEKKRGC